MSSSKWTCTDSFKDVNNSYKKTRRRRKINTNDNIDDLVFTMHESMTKKHHYHSWYNCNISGRKIKRWLMGKIGQPIDIVFSDFVKDLKLYKIQDLNLAKSEFWEEFDETPHNIWNRSRKIYGCFYLNPDKTIGFKDKIKPKKIKVEKHPKANWNNSAKPKGASLSRIIKEVDAKGICLLGKFYYINGNYCTKKPINISIVSRETWQDALTFNTNTTENHSHPDKFYLKLIKEWVPVNIEGIGTGVDLIRNYEYTSRSDNKYILIKKRFK